MIKYLLSYRPIHTDEEYIRYLKAKNKMFMVMGILGAILLISFYAARYVMQVEITSHAMGFYTGAGGALIAVALVTVVKNQRIMKNKKLVHKMRIKHSDERNVEISSKAFKVGALAQFLAIYVLALIGPFIDSRLSNLAAGLIAVYLLGYVISYFILSKKI